MNSCATHRRQESSISPTRRLRDLCSIGSPAHRGEATAVWRDVAPGSSPRKNGSSARVLTMTAAANLIRATVHNRVDNQVRGRRLTGRAVGRRPVRGVRSEEGKSGVKSLRAPSPGIRHRAQPARWLPETIPGRHSDHPRRRRPRQHHRLRTRFSTPTNPGAPAAPARWGGNRKHQARPAR